MQIVADFGALVPWGPYGTVAARVTHWPDVAARRIVAAQHPVKVHSRKRWPSRRVRLPLPTWEQIAGDEATLTMLRQIIAGDE